MTGDTPRKSEAPAGGGSALTTAALTAVLVLCGFQVWWGMQTRRRLDEMERVLASLERKVLEARAASPGGAAGDSEALESLRADFDLLVSEVQSVGRKVDDLTRSFENRGPGGEAEPFGPPELDWTQPELFASAQEAAASVGIALTKDEVRVPARVCIREGLLEYFACLKGGKEHETFLSLVGNVPGDSKRPPEFGAKLNTALQAIGFRRGKPIRFGPTGTKPATGDTVYLFVEWTTGGRKELVRAEDLVWNRIENRPMQRGRWVYVGSSFLEGEQPGTFEFAADLTAEAVATYSAPNTIVDNTEPGAQDDTVFLVATPRVPEDVREATLIFRRTDLEGAKEFPPIETPRPDEAPGGGGKDDDRGR
jgi:hypothetical protein